MSEIYIAQGHGNGNKKTRKWRHFIYGVMKGKIQEKTLNKIEAILAEKKRKMNTLKIKY